MSLITNRRAFSVTLIAAVSFMLAGAALADDVEPASTKLKGLLITGGCCHDYPVQTKIITEGISQRASISWDVVQEGDGREVKVPLYERPDWSKGYDIVVHNECFGAVDDSEFVEKIVAAHRDGGVPAVFIHCSMHSYRAASTDEWRKLLGVTSRRHEKAKRPLDVKKLDTGSPIMAAFPDTWKTPNGELYVIEKVWPTCTPLAQAYSPEEKSDQVCMWTNTYGKARVFGTTIGHHNETMLCDEWLDTVARGLLWTCGKLNGDGTPLAGYKGTGKGPLSFQVAAAAAAGEPTEANWAASVKFPESEQPVKLFNGKDFSGWEGHTDKYFSIKDGVIIAKNGAEDAPPVSTYLFTTKDYRNFRLVFEGKLVESKMHSGIALWGKRYETGGETHAYQGHLVMFPASWGYYDLFRRNSIYRDDGRAQKADNGGWNRMEILAIGSRIRLAVNGQEVADWTDPQPELCGAGPIALQLHSNKVAQEVHFRGLILSENPDDRLITLETN